MIPFWLSFTDGTHGCCEESTLAKAITKAEDLTGKVVANARMLPYPAVPRIGLQSDCPSFCHNPVRCAGRWSCPMDYACND
jgi:hypothetical protein